MNGQAVPSSQDRARRHERRDALLSPANADDFGRQIRTRVLERERSVDMTRLSASCVANVNAL